MGEKGYKHSWIEFAHLKNYGFLVHIKCGSKMQSSKTGLALLKFLSYINIFNFGDESLWWTVHGFLHYTVN